MRLDYDSRDPDVWSATTSCATMPCFMLTPRIEADRNVVAAFTFPVDRLLDSHSVVLSNLYDQR